MDKKQGDLSNYIFGKLPPQAKDLEEAVLGAMMLDRESVGVALGILKPESFYVDAHRKIFAAIKDLFARSQPVDIMTVTEELRKSGELENVGGPYLIMELTNRVASAANVEYHARIVQQKFMSRELISISTEAINRAYADTEDVFEQLSDAEGKLMRVMDVGMSRNAVGAAELLQKTITVIEQAGKAGKGEITGLPSGFGALDELTNGWQAGDLIVVGARPSMGKTSFVLSCARNAAIDFNKPVGIFSLEMTREQLMKRLLASETGIDYKVLERGALSEDAWKRVHGKTEQIYAAPIFIDDTPALNIFQLRAKARRLKVQYDVQLLVVDYLQLMEGTEEERRSSNREQEIAKISRGLKAVAKELGVPVIALSQLNRSCEARSGLKKRPNLSDLRESGAIEQDADLVMFLFRPEHYRIEEYANGESTRGIAEVIVAKHRNGACDEVPLRFVGRCMRFENAEYEKPTSSQRTEEKKVINFYEKEDTPF